jgi:hypothetical protein
MGWWYCQRRCCHAIHTLRLSCQVCAALSQREARWARHVQRYEGALAEVEDAEQLKASRPAAAALQHSTVGV